MTGPCQCDDALIIPTVTLSQHKKVIIAWVHKADNNTAEEEKENSK